MEDFELANLEKWEADHWYYRAKRRIAHFWLKRASRPEAGDKLLDVGCGTGLFAAEWGRESAVGADASLLALSLARKKGVQAERIKDDRLPFADETFNYATALDVLEHIQDHAGILAEMERVLKNGGLCLITVPALPFLWSPWDEGLGHFRRYTKKTLPHFAPNQWEVLRTAYFNGWAVPPIVAARRLQMWAGKWAGKRFEDKIPWGPVNRFLEYLMVSSACRPWYSPPWGTSLLVLLRKK